MKKSKKKQQKDEYRCYREDEINRAVANSVGGILGAFAEVDNFLAAEQEASALIKKAKKANTHG